MRILLKHLFQKGHKKLGGKKKGTPNKFTTLKNAFLKAFQELQKDKTAKLDKWGKMNPEHFYKMIATMLPKEIAVTGDENNPIPVKYIIEDTKKSK